MFSVYSKYIRLAKNRTKSPETKRNTRNKNRCSGVQIPALSDRDFKIDMTDIFK